MKKLKVALVHKGIWDMEKLSMPLACGYIKAFAMAQEGISESVDIEIFNYGGGHGILDMIPKMLFEGLPDILAFSVYGWNYFDFGRIAETYKMMKPDGLVIMGGVHVANQAKKVFAQYPYVDLVVNGEGEITFTELIFAKLANRDFRELNDIENISFRNLDGAIITTPKKDRLKDLNAIPSPFLTGAIPMLDENGEFLYDAVTMETNRGCPYKCSFCYWGGATGAKLYKFDIERIKEELTFFAKLKVENICLADANFGMIKEDEEIIDHLIELRSQYGYPTNMIPSWAKNKGKVFYRIVKKMKDAGLGADFTLALQTLDDSALEQAQRKNMKLNTFEDLCDFLNKENMDAYAELIWQLPGETYDSFLKGYDKTAEYTSRIATYNNLLLPNTEYYENREKYGFVTFRNEQHDYESILSHNTMDYESNLKMHHFLFWARVAAELMYFRHIFNPLRVLENISQSTVLLDLNNFVDNYNQPVSQKLNMLKMDVVRNLDVTRMSKPIRFLYIHEGINEMFAQWWEQSILPKISEKNKSFFKELFLYDFHTRPVHKKSFSHRYLEVVNMDGFEYYKSEEVKFNYDFKKILDKLQAGKEVNIEKVNGNGFHFYYRTGFENYIDNHEVVLRYTGQTMLEIEDQIRLRTSGQEAKEHHLHVVGLPDSSKSNDFFNLSE